MWKCNMVTLVLSVLTICAMKSEAFLVKDVKGWERTGMYPHLWGVGETQNWQKREENIKKNCFEITNIDKNDVKQIK